MPPSTRLLRQLLRLTGAALLWVALTATALPAQANDAHIELWPQVTVLSDETHALTFEQVLARRDQFASPDVPYANLGPRNDTVWLRAPVRLPPRAASRWWLVIDYPSLDEAELHVVIDGREVRRVLLGDHLAMSDRPVDLRPHAVEIDLPAGRSTELWLRVRTTGPMIVPLTLWQAPDLMFHESLMGLLQGAALGFGLCMLIYTLGSALMTREPLYLWYGIAVSAATLFFLQYSGIAPLFLWPDSTWTALKLMPITALVIVGAGFLFVERSLDMRAMSRHLHRAMQAGSAVSLLMAAAFALDVLNYRGAALASALLGPLPMVLALPVAFKRAHEGDRAAYWTFVGWLLYTAGVVVFVGLMRGSVEARGWALHAYQVSALLHLVAGVMVVNERVADLRRAAAQAGLEKDRALLLSQTDALTGLLNRRGLERALLPLLDAAGNGRFVGVYLLDLDGFKPVNDRHGHEAGDQLLVQVGHRLKDAVRAGDLVARLGGDEFVVIAQMRRESESEGIGRKLLDCCAEPFKLKQAQVTVGLTVGYALSPQDGRDAQALLRRADAAMYGGKHAGKGRVHRATDSLIPV